MKEIAAFLKGFADSVISLFDLLFAFLGDFMDFLVVLTKVPEVVGRSLSWLPGEILVYALILVGVVIVYKILGREG